MNLRNMITAAAVTMAAVSVGLPQAQAQTLSVTRAPGSYVFTVSVTPSTTLNTITFDFNGLVNFVSQTSPMGSTTYGPPASAADSSYTFFGPGFVPQTFSIGTFTFAPGPNSTATTYNITVGGPTFAAVTNGTLAAPEPGSLVSMSLLSACLGFGIVARRRKMLAN